MPKSKARFALMEKAPGTGGMPGWLKGLLIAFAVFAVLGTVAVVGGLFFVGKVAGDMQNPTKIRTIASSFMKVSEPLPTGFEFKFGFDFAGNKLVAIMNSGADSDFNIRANSRQKRRLERSR